MNHIRRLVLVLAALTIAVFAGLAVSSVSVRTEEPQQNRLDAVLAAKVLRVGTTGDYRPFSYLNAESKSFEGIDIDMARSLAKSLGVEVEFVQTSWPHLMDDLVANKFDIAMGGISVTLEREKKALFSIPLMVDGKAAASRCADKDKYQSLEAIDRDGVKVVTNPGGTNERFDRATLKHAAIEVYPDNKTIWQQLLDGKADVMITDASETMLWQKEHAGLCAIHPEEPFNFSEKAYLLPRDLLWKDFVDQWLHQAIETKEYKTAFERWFK
ncbi:MAG: transporter substrate-binding domain-containing protein [Alphaproteobacteria bacterium]